RVLRMSGRIGEDELPPPGLEVAIGNVDGDALLALGLEAVREEREVDGVSVPGRAADLLDLVVEERARLVEQPADQRALAVVDRPDHHQADELPGLAGRFHLLQRDHDQVSFALDDGAVGGEIERDHGNALELHVLPDVQLAPIGEREDADALALLDARVVEVPELRPLLARLPLPVAVAEGEDPLLGPRLLLVTASTAERRVVTPYGQRLEQRLRLEREGVLLAGMIEGVDSFFEC